MDKPLRILIVEDSDKDVALVVRALKAADYQVTYVVAVTATEMKAALAEQTFDIVISDHDLPQFDAPGALAELQQSGQDIPFIIVSGVIGEEIAVALMKAGAHDYVMKDKLARLVPAVQRELREAESRRERRRAAEKLSASEERFRTAAENLSDVVYDWDIKDKIDWYGDIDGVMGYPPGGFPRTIQAWAATIHPKDKDRVMAALLDHLKGAAPFVIEYRVGRRDGESRWWSVRGTALRDDRGEPYKMIGSITDITDRRMAEKKLKQTNIFLDSIIENIPDMIFLKDARDLRFIRFNRAGEDLLGQPRSDLLGKSDYDLFPKEQADSFTQEDRNVLHGKEVMDIPEESIQTRTRGERTLHTKKVPILNEDGGPAYLLGISEDITERKRNEEALRKAEETYRLVVDNMVDVITVIDLNLRFTYVSPSIIRLRGYTVEEVMAQTVEQALTPESLQLVTRVFEEELKLEAGGMADPDRSRILELEEYRKDGSTVWLENRLSFFRDKENKLAGIISLSHDITDRKRAEETLKKSEKKYRLLADNVNDVIFVLDMNLNFTYVSPSTKSLRGYEPEDSMKLSLTETLQPSSMELAMKTISDIMELEKMKKIKINESRTIPLEVKRKDGTTVWTEVKLSFIRDENKQAVSILGVTRDITERKLAEAELLRILESLRKSFSATIQVLVSAIEMRDPYTAGHQLRVADIARTIAKEMGLPRDKIEGIRMAGSIHDIGKLSIPSEILSKPTKLTNIEFSLIKEHARSGYDMLKDVDSPWPLAQIVYQHHERMDGSGYPRKLKGDEILVEARIMAVADVVEAMASHRPYRPGLGIDAALSEIEQNKGILYDNTVADACLRLFREKGYKLE